MKLNVVHSALGTGTLTTDRAESSYGMPVFVADEDNRAYGTQDAPGGVLTRPTGVKYSDDERDWLERILDQPQNPFAWSWRSLGAGRQAEGDEPLSERLQGRVTPSQAAKVEARGGWDWVRSLIDQG